MPFVSYSSIQPALEGKDIFVSPDGRVYHLGLKASELSPLIVTVGSQKRAALLASKFLTDVQAIRSDRQFHTFTGIAVFSRPFASRIAPLLC